MFVSILFLGKTLYFSKIYSPKYRVLLNIASTTFIHTVQDLFNLEKKSKKKEIYSPKNCVLLKIASVARNNKK